MTIVQRRNSVLSFLLCFLFLFSACVEEDPYGGITFEGEFGTPIDVDQVGGLLIAQVAIDGQEAGNFIVDTGAQLVFLDQEYATELGYGGSSFFINEIHVGELDFYSVHGSTLDLSVFENPLGIDLNGVLGSSLFQYFTVAVDYQILQFAIMDQDDEISSGLVDVERMSQDSADASLVIRNGLAFSQINVESERSAEFLLDTGATSTMVYQSFFDTFDHAGRPILVGSSGVGVEGVFPIDLSRFCGVTLGEASVDDLPIGVMPDTALGSATEIFPNMRGIIGETFFREFFTVFDFPSGTLRFYPYSSRVHILEDEFVQAGFILTRNDSGQVFVSAVFEDTDAENRGLEVNDFVISINGNAAEIYSQAQLNAVGRGTIGDTVELVVQRDSGQDTLIILIEDLLPSCR